MWNSNVRTGPNRHPRDGIPEPEDLGDRMNSFMGGPGSHGLAKGIADAENYANFNNYIRESLDRLGIQTSSRLDFSSEDPEDQAVCVNAVLDLIKVAESGASKSERNKDEIWSLSSQLKDYETNIRSLKGGINEVQDELQDVRVKYRAAEKSWNEKDKEMTKRIKDLEKQCKMVQNRDKQYVHSMRKLEMQTQKLKESRNKDIYETSKNAGVFFKVYNPLRKASRVLVNPKKDSPIENVAFLNDVLESYRDRTRAVELENYQLRSELRKFQEESIEMLLADTEGIEDVEIPSLPEDGFSLPFEDMKGSLEDAMRGINAIVRRRLSEDLSVDSLEHSYQVIKEQRQIIERQDRLIEGAIYDPLKEILSESDAHNLSPY